MKKFFIILIIIAVPVGIALTALGFQQKIAIDGELRKALPQISISGQPENNPKINSTGNGRSGGSLLDRIAELEARRKDSDRFVFLGLAISLIGAIPGWIQLILSLKSERRT